MLQDAVRADAAKAEKARQEQIAKIPDSAPKLLHRFFGKRPKDH